MSIQHDGKGHVIIGEAALSLALGKKKISVNTLIDELRHMKRAGGSDIRLSAISEAIGWLRSFDEPEQAAIHVPYLQTLAGLNDEKN
ncbi:MULTISPECIES: hypothetical protein [Pantoea]|uniref:hypothetical protein n=1 Tax=Pantoea TaxID=53335 RepID=UPI00073F2546|nr:MULTISPECIES: hypothetical protein [Pantoea]KAA8670867.1 hypothetical protein F4W08_11350 [Pantoea dispersa]MDI6633586.1 hypothetical protein [Pantoea dispersa]PPC73874.1 hypothetical protein C1Y42_01220 [Pantoea sp. ICBG 985]